MKNCNQFKKVRRRWGIYKVINTGKRFKVKILEIKPHRAIALQLHNFRSEHWVVVKGKAKVRKGKKTFCLNENESVFIPKKIKHRIENLTNSTLKVIEVQCGDYVEEDDIVRFEQYTK
jgi:mannose-6-phosphate isomerase-like protein (cupin superfamily)